MHNVTITPVLNGWSVKVGCQTVVFENADRLLNELRCWLADPQSTQKRFQSDSINARFINDTPVAPTPIGLSEPTCCDSAAQEARPREGNPVLRR